MKTSAERQWFGRSRWIFLAVMGAGVASICAAQSLLHPGESVPDFTLTAVRGGSFTLRQAARRPTLIAFLETFPDTADTPSRGQVALLESMYRQYSRRGLRVVIVDATKLNAGRKPDRDALINTTYDWNLEIPLLDDERGQVAQMFGVTHAPTTFLVNGDGTIAVAWEHPMAPGGLATAIEKALGGGPLASRGTAQPTMPAPTPGRDCFAGQPMGMPLCLCRPEVRQVDITPRCSSRQNPEVRATGRSAAG